MFTRYLFILMLPPLLIACAPDKQPKIGGHWDAATVDSPSGARVPQYTLVADNQGNFIFANLNDVNEQGETINVGGKYVVRDRHIVLNPNPVEGEWRWEKERVILLQQNRTIRFEDQNKGSAVR